MSPEPSRSARRSRGPQALCGSTGQPGTNGLNGTNGLDGTAGATGPQETRAAGPDRSRRKSPSSSKITCQLVSKVTTCTITYQYATTGAAAPPGSRRRPRSTGETSSSAEDDPRSQARIVLKHLHPGHYRITVRDLKRHGKSVVLASSPPSPSVTRQPERCPLPRPGAGNVPRIYGAGQVLSEGLRREAAAECERRPRKRIGWDQPRRALTDGLHVSVPGPPT